MLADLLLSVTTPALGVVFDIAGWAKKNVDPVSIAFVVCSNMACNKVATTGVIIGMDSEVESVPT